MTAVLLLQLLSLVTPDEVLPLPSIQRLVLSTRLPAGQIARVRVRADEETTLNSLNGEVRRSAFMSIYKFL